jgi:hypothetical protein
VFGSRHSRQHPVEPSLCTTLLHSHFDHMPGMYLIRKRAGGSHPAVIFPVGAGGGLRLRPADSIDGAAHHIGAFHLLQFVTITHAPPTS